MANFQVSGASISKQTISCIKDETRIVDLWGPENTMATPSYELDVTASPASLVQVKRSILPIAGRIRKWELKGLAIGTSRIEAKAGNDTWDSFDLEVLPRAYRFLLPEQKKFLRDLARDGKAAAKQNGFPLSAMMACGAAESRFGMSDIYKTTKCPFNLQKPANFKYPHCDTIELSTVNKEGAKAAPAPFCIAEDMADAARLWCEWIKFYPNEGARTQLIGAAGNARSFAEKLYLVGFADNRQDRTLEYGKLLDNYQLTRFD